MHSTVQLGREKPREAQFVASHLANRVWDGRSVAALASPLQEAALFDERGFMERVTFQYHRGAETGEPDFRGSFGGNAPASCFSRRYVGPVAKDVR